MKKILLVEDDPFLVDIYSQKLKKSGFDVVSETDGSKVLDVIKEVNPDLLMLDIVLPEMDGWQILNKIGEDKKFANLKVMIFSNLGQKTEVEKGIKLGAVKYLIKAGHDLRKEFRPINKNPYGLTQVKVCAA